MNSNNSTNIFKIIKEKKPRSIPYYFIYEYYSSDFGFQQYLNNIKKKIDNFLKEKKSIKKKKINIEEKPPLNDPYKDFLDNWEEDIKFYKGIDISTFNTIPNDVLFEIINKLIAQRNYYKTISEELQETKKQNKTDEEYDKFWKLLHQAYIDMINLQETGHLTYE